MMSNPQTAKKVMMMAKRNHIMLMGGMSVGGRPVTMKGELTGADCYLSAGEHPITTPCVPRRASHTAGRLSFWEVMEPLIWCSRRKTGRIIPQPF